MTNEQLAELIGEGGNDELLPLLWEKMRKLYRMWTDKYYSSHKERCDLCGVTADDLRQEAYLSMLGLIQVVRMNTRIAFLQATASFLSRTTQQNL